MFRILAVTFAYFGIIYGLQIGEHRVVNGTDADEGEFPYIVSLRRALTGSHTCGGSIIARQWILTAAHCVHRKSASDINIQYGVTEISADRRNVVGVSRIIINERYDHVKYFNDIALVELKKSLKYNVFVRSVTLPEQDHVTPENSEANLIGWGRNATEGSIQKHLQKVELITFSDKECYKRNNVSDNTKRPGPNNMCAGVPEGGKGQCRGDSGGPLTVHGIQVGIVSWSQRPCGSVPGVYTKVSSYIDWIKKYVKLK